MALNKKSEEIQKVSIPRQLQMALLRLQVADNLTWNETCLRAATLLDINSEDFKRLINQKAESIYKSRHLTVFNKAKHTIVKDA